MAIKTLQLNLDPPPFATGWYRDTATGQYYYYDAQADQWYVYAAGYLYPAAFYPPGNWEPAPKKVTVSRGDTLRIIVTFKYVGPAFSGNLYGAIGQNQAGTFDEILNRSLSLSIPEYTTPTTPSIPDTDIPITSAISAGTYAIYAKITDGIGLDVGKTISKYLENAVEVVGVEPEFSEFSITDYAKV